MATGVATEPLERFTDEQVASFWRDGFLVVEEGLIAPARSNGSANATCRCSRESTRPGSGRTR